MKLMGGITDYTSMTIQTAFISYNTLHCQVGTSLVILLENRLAEKAKIHTQL